MPRTEKQRLALVALAGLALGFALAGGLRAATTKDRPFLRFLAGAARTALWFVAFADAPDTTDQYEAHPAEGSGQGVVHVAVDAHGNRIVEHGRGW